jgi:hypothetical protein
MEKRLVIGDLGLVRGAPLLGVRERLERLMRFAFSPAFGRAFAPVFGPLTAAGGPTTLIYDTFTDSDGVHLHDHIIAPTNIPSTSWTDALGTMIISSNKATGVASRALVNPGVSDFRLDCDYLVIHISALFFRWLNVNNRWYLRMDVGATWKLYEVTGGVETLRASCAIPSNSGTITIQCSASTINIYYNNTLQLSYTSTAQQTNTILGLYSNIIGNTFDNFKVTTL